MLRVLYSKRIEFLPCLYSKTYLLGRTLECFLYSSVRYAHVNLHTKQACEYLKLVPLYQSVPYTKVVIGKLYCTVILS